MSCLIDYVVNQKNYSMSTIHSWYYKRLKKFRKISSHTSRGLNNKSSKLVIDIGSNDSSILKGFKRLGFEVLGIAHKHCKNC